MMMNQEKNKVIVIGKGETGVQTAQKFSEKGFETTLVILSPSSIKKGKRETPFQWITGAKLSMLDGGVGLFDLSLVRKNKIEHHLSDAIVIASDVVLKKRYSHYDISPANPCGAKKHKKTLQALLKHQKIRSSPYIFSFSSFMIYLKDMNDKKVILGSEALGGVVFICGLYNESHPGVVKKILALSYQMRTQYDLPVYFLTRNLKVAEDGNEALSRKARREGVGLYKFTNELPTVTQGKKGKVTIAFNDEITGTPVLISPHFLVFEDTFLPDDMLLELSEKLNIPLCEDGYLATGNAHRFSVKSLRKGIFPIFGARGVFEAEQLDEEIDNALYEVQRLNQDKKASFRQGAFIEKGLCVRCLTCHRICSYRAVKLGDKDVVEIMPLACEACGICISVCPGKAISMVSYGRSEPKKCEDTMLLPEEVASKIVLFCCRRSGGYAREYLNFQRFKGCDDIVFIDVPCAGRISEHMLLETFEKNAEGVMVLNCHSGNCHSEEGTGLSQKRIQSMGMLLDTIGIEKKRLAFFSLAANMGPALGIRIQKFAQDLNLPLKTG